MKNRVLTSMNKVKDRFGLGNISGYSFHILVSLFWKMTYCTKGHSDNHINHSLALPAMNWHYT